MRKTIFLLFMDMKIKFISVMLVMFIHINQGAILLPLAGGPLSSSSEIMDIYICQGIPFIAYKDSDDGKIYVKKFIYPE